MKFEFDLSNVNEDAKCEMIDLLDDLQNLLCETQSGEASEKLIEIFQLMIDNIK